jgi:hypothetical protein
MAFNPDLAEIQAEAKRFIDANVHDGDGRSGCDLDWVMHTPDDLQELVNDLLEHLAERRYI